MLKLDLVWVSRRRLTRIVLVAESLGFELFDIVPSDPFRSLGIGRNAAVLPRVLTDFVATIDPWKANIGHRDAKKGNAVNDAIKSATPWWAKFGAAVPA